MVGMGGRCGRLWCGLDLREEAVDSTGAGGSSGQRRCELEQRAGPMDDTSPVLEDKWWIVDMGDGGKVTMRVEEDGGEEAMWLGGDGGGGENCRRWGGEARVEETCQN
ncbi:hypothetical protein E2562_029725 [Oryza meyeriana var. granulata]|uniref:Uncharacterized protein n=1 Tax=Oryza meyeriana var. granulata TaxID=110450 RepID=A0A6G1EQX1_9ORYZ|nr:hypothetical protein E2562_029725 [Oryza meyeriana var. granulata]